MKMVCIYFNPCCVFMLSVTRHCWLYSCCSSNWPEEDQTKGVALNPTLLVSHAMLQVAAQLVRQGCVSSTKELKKKKTSTVRLQTCQTCFIDWLDLLGCFYYRHTGAQNRMSSSKITWVYTILVPQYPSVRLTWMPCWGCSLVSGVYSRREVVCSLTSHHQMIVLLEYNVSKWCVLYK